MAMHPVGRTLVVALALHLGVGSQTARATTPTPSPSPTPTPLATSTPQTLTSLLVSVTYPASAIQLGTSTNLLTSPGGQFIGNVTGGTLKLVATSDPSILGGTITSGNVALTPFSCVSGPPVAGDFACTVDESDREGVTIPATCAAVLCPGTCPGNLAVTLRLSGDPAPVPACPPTPTPTPVVTITPIPTPTPVVTPTPIDVIFLDDFESGNLTKWANKSDKGVPPPPHMYVAPAAKLGGSQGLLFDVSGLPPPANRAKLWVKDTTPTLETRYRARFSLNLNTLTVATSPRVLRFLAGRVAGDASRRPFELRLRYVAPNWFLYGIVRSDGDALNFPTAPIPVPRPGWSTVEIDWKKASGPGANDGSFSVRVNATAEVVGGVDNDQVYIDGVQLGFLGGLGLSSTGTVFIDDFESRRQGPLSSLAPLYVRPGLESR